MRKTKFISMFLAVCFVIMLLPSFALAATSLTDMPNDYSTVALEAAVANGLLKGSDGKILPDDNLTRSQMAAIISRAFGATQQASLTGFSDVPASAWYYSDMGKAVQMKVLNGDSGLLKPEAAITRQEAFAVLARSLKLKDGTAADLAAFADKADVASWAVGTTAAMITNGYIHGADGKINPKANISRKDFAVLMNNIVKNYITTAGIVTEVKAGSVMINVPGVTLQNVTVKGNLIIGDGVGNGNVTLDNVKVEGSTIVRGGGVNSFIVKGNSSLGTVTIAKVDGNVRVSVEGDAKVEIVEIKDGKNDVLVEGNINKLEVASADVPVVVQKATVKEIKVTAEKADVTIAKDAKVTTISAEAANTSLTVAGTVETLTATKAAEGAKIEVAKGASVGTVNTAAAKTEIKGEGSVQKANITADGVKVDTSGTQLTVGSGVTGTTTGGKAVAPGTTTTDGKNPSSGGNSGGSSGGGTNPLAVTSKVEQDPGYTGGTHVIYNASTKTFSGTVDYYAADKDLNRAEGNYVGVKISAPTGVIVDKDKATFAYTNAKGDKMTLTGKWLDGDNYVYYYPRISSAPQTFTITIDWDGTGNAYAPETIEIKIKDGTTLNKPAETVSTVEKDPGNTGGTDALFNSKTKTFSGIIDYYAADASIGRTEGNRVGVKITAPNEVAVNTAKATFTYTNANNKEVTLTGIAWLDGKAYAYYYPLVTSAPQTFTIVIDWDGTGLAYAPETITINIDADTLLKNSNNSKITKVASSSELATALTSAAADETIYVLAGTYTDDITIDKAVTIQGVGNTTVFTGGITVASDKVSLKNFKLSYAGELSVNNQKAGIAVGDVAITTMTVKDVAVEKYYYGMISTDTNQNVTLSGLTVESCTFQGNLAKGFYAVNLTDSTFKNCQFLNNATTAIDSGNPLVDRSGAGIDLNLMSSVDKTTYNGIVIDGCTFTNNGMLNKADGSLATGGDIKIKVRGGSVDPSYNKLPLVTVTGTVVKNCTFGADSPRHIVIGTSKIATTFVDVNYTTANTGLSKIIDNSKVVSTVEKDPGSTGGAAATFDSSTKTFSGTIDYYAADASIGRTEGNRVGVKITAPNDVEIDAAKASFKYTSNGVDTTLINGTTPWLDGKNFVYYYPLVTAVPQTFTVVIDWDGEGVAYAPETITINVANGTFLKDSSNTLDVNTETELFAAASLPSSAASPLKISLSSSITLTNNLSLPAYSSLFIPTNKELTIPSGKTLTVDSTKCAVQVFGVLNLKTGTAQAVINRNGNNTGAVHVYADGKVLTGTLEYIGSTDNSYFKITSGFISAYNQNLDNSPAILGQAITIEGIADSKVILQGATGTKTHTMGANELISINDGSTLTVAAGVTLDVVSGAQVLLGGTLSGTDATSILKVGATGNCGTIEKGSTFTWDGSKWAKQ